MLVVLSNRGARPYKTRLNLRLQRGSPTTRTFIDAEFGRAGSATAREIFEAGAGRVSLGGVTQCLKAGSENGTLLERGRAVVAGRSPRLQKTGNQMRRSTARRLRSAIAPAALFAAAALIFALAVVLR